MSKSARVSFFITLELASGNVLAEVSYSEAQAKECDKTDEYRTDNNDEDLACIAIQSSESVGGASYGPHGFVF